MDIATIIGLIGVLGVMLIGMSGNVMPFLDVPSVAIVVGGTIVATAIAFPGSKIFSSVSVVKNAFIVKSQSPITVIKQIVEFAEQARREGILALESRALEITDEFMKMGIQLAVDGTEPDLIKEILSTEISYTETRHGDGAKLLEFAAAMAPSFGMIGTVIGLILMLGNLTDIDSLGPNMAVAMITTFYGALVAFGICTPLVEKLKTYSRREILIKELMLEGIMSLQSGDNPRIVEQKLTVFLEPSLRLSVMKEKK
ncbi:MAG: motility protein A [Chitinispirillales bacterium]|jgi:chemotaxis protein MotA|nr:motility protein A [Chitinispirillales bacterium]